MTQSTPADGDIIVWDAGRKGWFTRSIGPLAWTAFPFAVSMSNYGAGFQACEYARDDYGVVHLRGLLKMTGIPVNPQTVGTLPVGYRPTASELFSQMGSYTGGNIALRVDVNVGGGVVVNSASGVAWDGGDISLSGITFSTT